MQTPFVSIIIPCYNSGDYIEETIASVEKCDSSFSTYELIIVNDGSTEVQTVNVLERLEKQGYKIINQSNQGLGAARNKGIECAAGKYILPLDADDRIRPCFLPLGIQVLEQQNDVGAVYGNAVYFEHWTGDWILPPYELEKLLLYNYIYASAIFRKSIWEDCGGYDTNKSIQSWADWEFWLSIAERGWKFHHLQETVFEYRIRKESMSSLHREAQKTPEHIDEYMVQKHPKLYKKVYAEIYTSASWYNHWQKHPLRGAAKLALTKAKSFFR